MKIGYFVMTLAAIALPSMAPPAQAQDNPVRACILDCAYPDFTNTWCVIACNERYGGEQTGGGSPDPMPLPVPGCRVPGADPSCNVDVRPD